MTTYKEMVKFQAGYPGYDPMREKAKGVFGDEFEDTQMYERGSKSAPSNTPPRLYNKGGRVNSYKDEVKEWGGRLTDLHIPHEISITEMREEPMKHKKGCYKAMGGRVNNLENSEFLSPRRTVYEREMLGERPSKRRPHIDYEDTMHGEKPIRKAKFAAGGVAKIRHGQSSLDGHQKAPRKHKMK